MVFDLGPCITRVILTVISDTFIKLTYCHLALLYKLDGVGPVDNRPSTDKLHHFFQKK